MLGDVQRFLLEKALHRWETDPRFSDYKLQEHICSILNIADLQALPHFLFAADDKYRKLEADYVQRCLETAALETKVNTSVDAAIATIVDQRATIAELQLTITELRLAGF